MSVAAPLDPSLVAAESAFRAEQRRKAMRRRIMPVIGIGSFLLLWAGLV